MKKINNLCFLLLRQSSIFFFNYICDSIFINRIRVQTIRLCMNSSLLSFDKSHSICRYSVVISFIRYFRLNMFGYFLFGGKNIELNEFLMVILSFTLSLGSAWFWSKFSLCKYIFSLNFCLTEAQSSMRFEKKII